MCEKPENDYLKQVTSPLARSRPTWQDLPAAVWRARSIALFGYELTCVWLPDDEIRARQQSQRAPMEHGSHRNEE